MSESGPFAAAVDHANQWLGTVATALGDDDRRAAWSALRAVLHVLRDHLTHDEAAHLAAQLPLIMRGTFYEGWRPSETPRRTRDPAVFLGEIVAAMGLPPAARPDPAHALVAVVAALAQHGMGRELAQVQQQLPKPIQELWLARV